MKNRVQVILANVKHSFLTNADEKYFFERLLKNAIAILLQNMKDWYLIKIPHCHWHYVCLYKHGFKLLVLCQNW